MMIFLCFFFNDTATTEIYTYDTLFPYTTLFRSPRRKAGAAVDQARHARTDAPHRRHRKADRHRQPRLWPRQPPGDDRHPQGEGGRHRRPRSEEHTSELQSLMRISYAVFCLTKKK